MNARLAIVLALLSCCVEAKTPDFMTICRRNHPDLSQCIMDSANQALPHFLKGVKELNIPPLTNLTLPRIYNRPNSSYALKFDGKINSLEGAYYSYVKFDLNELVTHAKFNFPKLQVHGEYEIEGILGVLPIKGLGNASVTLGGVTQEVIWKYSLVNRREVTYVKLDRTFLLSRDVQLASYQFDNLFEANEMFGLKIVGVNAIAETVANAFLNENWRLLEENFTPYVLEVVFSAISGVADAVFEAYSFDELFPL